MKKDGSTPFPGSKKVVFGKRAIMLKKRTRLLTENSFFNVVLTVIKSINISLLQISGLKEFRVLLMQIFPDFINVGVGMLFKHRILMNPVSG